MAAQSGVDPSLGAAVYQPAQMTMHTPQGAPGPVYS